MKQLIYSNGFMHKVNIIKLESEQAGYKTKELMRIFKVSQVT